MADQECWSRDEENYSYDSLDELLANHDDLVEGDTVYVGKGEIPDPGSWVDADDLLEYLSCRANDECGEFADDYPDVTKEAKEELQALLETWARKHCTPTFYKIKESRQYEITAEDMANAHSAGASGE